MKVMGVMRGKPESRKYCKAQIWLTFDSFQSTRDCLGETRELWPSLKPFINISNLSEETATPENNTERPPATHSLVPFVPTPIHHVQREPSAIWLPDRFQQKPSIPRPTLKGSRHDDN